MTRLRHALALPAALAVEAGAVIVLHRLGAVPGLDAGVLLLPGAAPADALMAAARLAALAAAWWLLASTVVSAAACVTTAPAGLRALARVAPGPIRLLAARAVAATLSVSIATGGAVPAAADFLPVPGPVVRDGVVIPPGALPPGADDPGAVGVATAGASTTAGGGVSGGQARGGDARDGEVDGGDARAGAVHVVAPGEHLWAVASARVATGAGERSPAAPTSAAIARYWRRLVAANRHTLRSGDPDVVHPGERLVLPPLDDAGAGG